MSRWQLTHLHFNASISFPGVSKHLRIRCVCCLTTVRASSNSLAWSSTAGGEAMILNYRWMHYGLGAQGAIIDVVGSRLVGNRGRRNLLMKLYLYYCKSVNRLRSPGVAGPAHRPARVLLPDRLWTTDSSWQAGQTEPNIS